MTRIICLIFGHRWKEAFPFWNKFWMHDKPENVIKGYYCERCNKIKE